MTKKTRLFIFACCYSVFIIGCGKTEISSGVDNSVERDAITVNEINYEDIPWDETVGDFTDNLNISEETAIKIANLLMYDFNPNYMEGKKVYFDFVKNKNIYVVHYYPEPIQAGGDLNIAINSKTGEVLKMWAGE